MPESYKVLGQSNLAGATASALYVAPPATSAIVSTLFICNQASSSASFRVAIRPGGVALNSKNYLYYDSPILANDGISITAGIALSATDALTVYGSTASLSFTATGVEIT